ncbi:MAG TPA: hypothetical protein VE825_00380 [Terriglobales bacterium]|jgi:hypothetical protein|nr:hypothetical protein [Terriglobales bacterium]
MPAPAHNQEPLTARLARASTQLHELEQGMQSGDIDPRILSEFRESVDHVRQTAWAVQQWMELSAAKRDPFSVLNWLAAERVRIGTQVSRELCMDLDASEVNTETPGIQKLYHEVRGLLDRLSKIVKREP